MEERYDSMKEFMSAIEVGELDPEDVVAVTDNDSVTFHLKDDYEVCLLSYDLPPVIVLDDLLDWHGIDSKPV